jgi:DNA-binding PadR family transcriptional regulator
MRNEGGLRYAVLGVVSRNESGVHGWLLKKQFDRTFGEFWQLNFGETYRILDRLAKDSLIEKARSEPGSSRKVFRITEEGRRSLDDFILAPPTDAPRPLRQELTVKLLFAGAERLPSLLRLISYQREAYMTQLNQLAIDRRKMRRQAVDAFVTAMIIDNAELHVRAELTWLDDVERKLKERFRKLPS